MEEVAKGLLIIGFGLLVIIYLARISHYAGKILKILKEGKKLK